MLRHGPDPRRPCRPFAAGMLALALLAVACGGETPTTMPRQGPATPTAAPTDEAAAPEPSPEETIPVPRGLRFTAPALSGGEIRGAEYAGKDLVIFLWAPW